MAKQIKKHGKIALIIGLILILVAMYIAIPMAKAGNLINREVKLSDSRPSQCVDYDFEADESASSSIKCIKVEFCTSTSGDCGLPPNMDISNPTTTSANWNNLDVSKWNDIAASTTYITVTTSDAVEYLGADGSFVFGNVTSSDTAATYYAKINTYSDESCSTGVDSGTVAFAIISGVTVSATVAETLSFSIASTSESNCDTTFIDWDGPDETTATSVAFGTLAAVDTFNHGCQDLTISTNASSGYSVVVQETTNLRNGTINIADSTGDSGSMDESVTSTWATAADNAGFGYACANISGSDCSMNATTSYRQFACMGTDAQCDPLGGGETAQNVMASSTAVSSSQSRVEYKLTVSGTQEAGSYSNTIVYIATPTY